MSPNPLTAAMGVDLSGDVIVLEVRGAATGETLTVVKVAATSMPQDLKKNILSQINASAQMSRYELLHNFEPLSDLKTVGAQGLKNNSVVQLMTRSSAGSRRCFPSTSPPSYDLRSTSAVDKELPAFDKMRCLEMLQDMASARKSKMDISANLKRGDDGKGALSLVGASMLKARFKISEVVSSRMLAKEDDPNSAWYVPKGSDSSRDWGSCGSNRSSISSSYQDSKEWLAAELSK